MSQFESLKMDRALWLLERISIELGRTNKNIEKFLKRTDARIPDTHVMARDVPIPNPLVTQDPPPAPDGGPVENPDLDMIWCTWCMGEISDHKHYCCDHGTLCEACAPCDECKA